MKVLIDMNLSPRWVNLLNADGLEAAHWSTLGAATATDVQIMTYARTHDYIVLTNDLDFSAILAATHGNKPSVMQIRADDVSPTAIGSAVIEALKRMQPELISGALITIEPDHTRLRLLPLHSKH